ELFLSTSPKRWRWLKPKLTGGKMIQGIIAFCLLILAIGLYLWGRRSKPTEIKREDPNVILGLSPAKESEVVVSKPSPPVEKPKPVVTQILFVRAPNGKSFAGYELL